MRVLVVDDDEGVREVVLLSLEDLGVECASVAGVDDAKAALSLEHFDIVLSDIRMPNGSGFHLLDYVRPAYPEIPVILMSGWYGDLDYAKHSRPRLPVLRKPFCADDLMKALHSANALISAGIVPLASSVK